MNNIDFSQTLPIFKELAEYYPNIADSEFDLFNKCAEKNLVKDEECKSHLYMIFQLIKKTYQVYLELSDRSNDRITLLYNLRNEPTKTINNYLKKIEMANHFYSQIMFDDEINYYALIEKIMNDFKDNPSETMQFFQNNRTILDSTGGAWNRPSFENGYKELYTRENRRSIAKPPKEHYDELKKKIVIDYYYVLLQAYPLISKDVKQVEKKLFISASIKIFKYLKLSKCSIQPYKLKTYLEEFFYSLGYSIKVYPDKIEQSYPFALHKKHYIYKYLNKDDSYRLHPQSILREFHY